MADNYQDSGGCVHRKKKCHEESTICKLNPQSAEEELGKQGQTAITLTWRLNGLLDIDGDEGVWRLALSVPPAQVHLQQLDADEAVVAHGGHWAWDPVAGVLPSPPSNL